MYDYRCPKNCGSDKTKCTTIVDRRFVKFLSETNVYHYFHDCRENVYFPYTALNVILSEIARLEGITTETMPMNERMCVV